MRLTDEQCEAMILEDCNYSFMRHVAFFQISKRRFQVIGTATLEPNGWSSNDGRPIDNVMKWEPMTTPDDYHKTMQVLAYIEAQLRVKYKRPPTPEVCPPRDARPDFSKGVSLPPK